MEKLEQLQEIGLHRNEAKLYLTLVEQGPATALQAAARSDIYRTNAYDALDGLLEKGLVKKRIEKKKNFFVAVSPKRLQELLAQQLVPLLKQCHKKAPTIQLYVLEGTKAIRHLLLRFLESKQPRYTIGIPLQAPSQLGPFLERYHRDRIQAKIPVYHLYHATAAARAKQANKMECTEAKLLPKSFQSPVSTEYTDKPVTIHIQNPAVAQAYRRYFDLLWESGKMP
jgi:predicted transcriptional regulator